MKINERIKQLRINKGMSQEELAKKMGYTSISTISRIETGGNSIPINKLEKLAEILGTTTEYLLKGNNNSNMQNINNTLGSNIRNLRIKKGLTQTELGDKFGVTKTAVSNWEKNLREPNIETIDKLAKVFNVDMEMLVNGKSNGMGDRIKSLRLDSGLSQEALAELIGVNVQNVFRYEKGIITDLPISRIEKVAEALNTTTDYLINGNTNIQGVSSIGDRLKAVRKNKGLTLEQLAEIFSNRHNSNIHKSMLSNWENNKVQPTIDSLNMYSSYFNVTIDYLLNGTNSILPEPIIENLGIEIVPKIETINEVDYVSSRTIAEQLGKEHKNLIRDIDNIVEGVGSDLSIPIDKFFVKSSFIDNQNQQEYREYLLTRDGFTLYMFNIQV